MSWSAAIVAVGYAGFSSGTGGNICSMNPTIVAEPAGDPTCAEGPAMRATAVGLEGLADGHSQRGPGQKHDRKIELEPWQREVVDRFPRESSSAACCTPTAAGP